MQTAFRRLATVCLISLLPLIVRADGGGQAITTLVRGAPTPKLDGLIAAGEWTGPVLQGFYEPRSDHMDPRAGWFTLASDGKTLFVAIQTPVHPRYGPLARARNPNHGVDPEEIIYDDSIEIWVAPWSEDAGAYAYRAMFSTLGGYSTGRFPLARPGFVREHWDTGNNVVRGSRIDGSIWTLEAAIPIDALDIGESSPGFRIRVCRNYKMPWATTRNNRGGGYNSDAATMMLVRLVDEAATVVEPDWVGITGTRASLTLRNPTDRTMSVLIGGETVELPGGGERELPLAVQVGEDNVRQVEVTVTAPDGTIIHRRTARWTLTDKPLWEEVL